MRRRCTPSWTAPIGALLALLLLAAPPLAVPLRAMPPRVAGIAVCFAPPLPGGCDAEATVIGAIAAARRSVRLQIYAFTSRPILAALVAARQRGVVVRVIIDRGQFHGDRNDTQAVRRLAAAGVPVFVDRVPGLMHDKIMIVDAATVLTGSFNYTWSAEHRNAENLVVIRDPAVVGAYVRNWRVRLAASRPLAGMTSPPVRARAREGLAQEAGTRQAGTREAGTRQAGTRQAGTRQAGTREMADGPTGAVRGNRNTRIYQWPGCRYYDRIGAANRVEFPSADAARAAGYRAARNCR